jgi:hypothetical protein
VFLLLAVLLLKLLKTVLHTVCIVLPQPVLHRFRFSVVGWLSIWLLLVVVVVGRITPVVAAAVGFSLAQLFYLLHHTLLLSGLVGIHQELATPTNKPTV